MKDLSDYDDEALAMELNRRQIRKAMEAEKARKEEQRIYNLPENVEKRRLEYLEVAYKRVLGRTLLDNRISGLSEDTDGVWKVYGEDPNCDLAGPHREPYLGKVKGTLKAAILFAINHPGFFSWGGGGRIEASEPEKIIELES